VKSETKTEQMDKEKIKRLLKDRGKDPAEILE